MPSFTIAPESLHRLRQRLQAAGSSAAADILQDAGFATGEALNDLWRNQIAAHTGLDDAGRLDVRWFGPLLDEVCVELGWGSLCVTPVGDRAVLLEGGEWAEAEPGTTEHPACHFSCGLFAAFLTAQAGAPMSVLEVECRSSGNNACRFLAGSTATLATVYDVLAAGRPWREAFDPADLPAN
ncbi:MAG: 4-vinyl reductase [Gemmatimonadota bacterium]